MTAIIPNCKKKPIRGGFAPVPLVQGHRTPNLEPVRVSRLIIQLMIPIELTS